VERGDVLERDEDVTVQLDVRDVLDVAVGGQDAFLVFPAEQRDLDLLALVFVGVVLDRAQGSRFGSTNRVAPAVFAPKSWAGVVPVWSRRGGA
jgi:hypothetical protein